MGYCYVLYNAQMMGVFLTAGIRPGDRVLYSIDARGRVPTIGSTLSRR
jgi:hypothetical protein